MDFLEIAAYVFAADCATEREKVWTDRESTEPWSRDLTFVIPVRDPDFWSSATVKRLIEEVLGFLSNDKYSFIFGKLSQDRRVQPYFKFRDQEKWPFHSPDRVVMFSGGLDSLAGAVETAATGSKLVLVSHRPASTIDARQRNLFESFGKHFPKQSVRIPVWINKKGSLGREPTQRTRSFLFTALGTLVAHSIEANGIRFYENGVVSLNLPLAGEVLRARASRTTHPIALHLLASLCTAVMERDFIVDNPYLFKTKTEVVTILASHRAEDLIAYSCSCAHTIFKLNKRRHCGLCSQCIDRRFAMAGANLLAHDPAADYVSDVFVGPRERELDRVIAVDYTLHGIELHRQSESHLAGTFNAEIGRAVRYEPERNDAARQIISMHKRHGEVVAGVLRDKVAEYSPQLVDGALEKTSLLALFIGQSSLQAPALSPQAQHALSGEGKLLPTTAPAETALARIEDKLDLILARTESAGVRIAKSAKKQRKPTRRDTFLFAGILMDLTGLAYCRFLDDRKIKPKWSEEGPNTYVGSYQRDDRHCKRVHDEKYRASQRLERHADAVLAEAFITHLPLEFDHLSELLRSRNSRGASKTLHKSTTA